MMIPIDKMSTTDKVIESIRSYIQEPGRNPGEKLPTENELGKQLGVGRSSIREALRVLQTMGYVRSSTARARSSRRASPAARRPSAGLRAISLPCAISTWCVRRLSRS